MPVGISISTSREIPTEPPPGSGIVMRSPHRKLQAAEIILIINSIGCSPLSRCGKIDATHGAPGSEID